MAKVTQQDELLLLRALLRASDYGVLLSGLERRDLICNKRFCDLFGLDAADTLNSEPGQVRALVLPRLKDPDGFVQTLDAVYADPRLTREDEIELIAPRPRLLRRYTGPVLDDQGVLIGRLWTFLDITRTRRLEARVRAQGEQLKAQARELASALKAVSVRLHKTESTLNLTQQRLFESEKLSAVGLLAASVAHDIRNILTPLAIEVALADQNEPRARAEALTAMRTQVDRLSLLTHRLLALARPSHMDCQQLDMQALLLRIVEQLRTQAAVENVKIETRLPRRLPPAEGDPVQIDQVLVNLTLNAVQAMNPQGGGTLRLSLARRNEGVCVTIDDTGPGIPLSIRRRLFDPFFTTKPDGAGLGLFSCRRIIQAHGGTIRVRNMPGGGARFSVWLPSRPKTTEGKSDVR